MAIQAHSPLLGTQDSMENGWVNQSFSDLQQQQQFQNQQQMYQNQNLLASNSLKNSMVNTNTTSLPSMPFYQSLAAQEEKQRQEMDQFIRLQNERLRLMLREQRKQQLGMVLKKIESTTMPLLRQKDEEIAQGTKRAMELEDFLKRLEMENQAWQRTAQENEAMVVSLNNTLEQLMENNNNGSCGGFYGREAEDVESCCDADEDKKAELNREEQKMMVCRGCKSRNSCVLFLPCRHLCSCQVCESFLDSCPICNTVKNASIEVLL
ncbi:BOI-related E3 ubiquitin-protein ligase 2 [Tripterygium wilfordii]|uniref:BOI-related E3 ubiquitin-protein ligase 2 n=1 Tax=Tripterygium wilfordii TaxID=458696 RepID=A0A7J7E042_TRIWF|nr:probable BOI-related E3 ubiquitin-protein ligase 2 [Tripterygium wilfordii]KAF5752010.1 BOI-related E3 ubiquitin-protein ligase 2 [Tripterygium wilfordii]